MKTTLTIITSLLLSGSLMARLGETEAQLKARFGEGQLSDTQRQPGALTYKYFKNGFEVEVAISQGKSIFEIIHHPGKKGEFPEADIKAILDGYKTDLQRIWHFDRKEKRWESNSKPKFVAYRWPGHEDFFCLKDVAACETLDKAAPGSKGL